MSESRGDVFLFCCGTRLKTGKMLKLKIKIKKLYLFTILISFHLFLTYQYKIKKFKNK